MGASEELRARMRESAAIKPAKVETKRWGAVYVKPPTVEEVDESTAEDEEKRKEESEAGRKDRRRFARAAARVLCDEEGNRLFDPSVKEDIDLLAAQPWADIQAVMAAADRSAKEGN